MSERIVEVIIGAAYVAVNGRFFAADIYKGNYYKLMENNTVKIVPLVSRDYERVVAQYEECVKNDKKITSAYELNARAHHNFEIPAVTADPEAAEKEWYIRTHPQVVETPQVEEPKKGFFGKKTKKNINIKCLECGAINSKAQKYCGECGKRLVSADEEVLQASEEAKEDAALPIAEDTKSANDEEIKETDLMDEIKPEDTDNEMKEPGKKEKVKRKKKEKTEEEKPGTEETDELKKAKPKKKGAKVFFIILLILLLLAGIGAGVYFYLFGGFETIIYNESKQTVAEVTEPAVEEVKEEAAASFVVIKLKNATAMGAKITEADIEGTILSKEQFEKYNAVSTYIDKNGEKKDEKLLLWEEKDAVIGKYAARDLSAGSILYDTSITSEHVVADKTFVDVEIDGEGNTIEVEGEVLPGNTRIQIVAIVQTDGAEPVQMLLSEMTLQDRSLESIFNSAGQDILEMLSTKEQTQEAEDNAEEEATAENTTETTQAGE